MKNTIIIIILSLTCTLAYSQEQDTTFLVNGVCGMCQKTIYSALDVDGVESAKWSPETKVMNLTFDASVITFNKVHQLILGAGYDTEFETAPESNYEALNPCCKYRDPEVISAH